MTNIEIINGDKEKISDFLKKYNDCKDSLNDEIWQGRSKNKFITKSEEFIKGFSTTLNSQMSMLSSAVSLFNQYKEKQSEKIQLETNYNNAVAKKDEVLAAEFSKNIKKLSTEMERIKEQIKTNLSEITKLRIKNEFVNYYQTDYNDSYGYGSNIARAGCGPTSMAMVLTYLTGDEVTPPDAAKWSLERGYRVSSGTAWTYYDAISEEYDIECDQSIANKTKIKSTLEEGNPIILSMKPGHFTSGGHFIVLNGVNEEGKITVADPNSRARSEQAWDIDLLISESKQMWTFTS